MEPSPTAYVYPRRGDSPSITGATGTQMHTVQRASALCPRALCAFLFPTRLPFGPFTLRLCVFDAYRPHPHVRGAPTAEGPLSPPRRPLRGASWSCECPRGRTSRPARESDPLSRLWGVVSPDRSPSPQPYFIQQRPRESAGDNTPWRNLGQTARPAPRVFVASSPPFRPAVRLADGVPAAPRSSPTGILTANKRQRHR